MTLPANRNRRSAHVPRLNRRSGSFRRAIGESVRPQREHTTDRAAHRPVRTASARAARWCRGAARYFSAPRFPGDSPCRLMNGVAPPPVICGSSPFHFSSALYCTNSDVSDFATVEL